jgi:hypothetical protein
MEHGPSSLSRPQSSGCLVLGWRHFVRGRRPDFPILVRVMLLNHKLARMNNPLLSKGWRRDARRMESGTSSGLYLA